MSVKETVGTALNAVLVLCAIVVTFFVARSAFQKQSMPTTTQGVRLEAQDDWQSWMDRGNLIGSADADVTLIEFGDFECPACRALARVLKDVVASSDGKVAVLYRHMPLESHRFSEPAALAAECAAREGRFEAMHDTLFVSQKSFGLVPWTELALSAGVEDTTAFRDCMKDNSALAVISEDRAAAARLGVNGTPTVLVNGVRFAGVPRREVIDSLISLRSPALRK